MQLLFKKLSKRGKTLSSESGAFRGKVRFCTTENFMTKPQTADRNLVFCAPFRTASAYPFSFPFGRKVNLRGALELKFRPLVGEGAALSTVIQATERGKDKTRGAAWFVSRGETENYEKLAGERAAIIPAPLALLSEVAGDGLLIWHEGGYSCALWAEGYEPKLYRCFDDEEYSPEEASRWMRSYAQSSGGKILAENVRIYEAEDILPYDLQRAGEATFAAAPSIAALDFSNRGASAAERRERFFARAFSALRTAGAVGLFCLALSLALLARNLFIKETFAAAPSRIYFLALGEESRAPLTSAVRQLRALSSGTVQMSLDGVLAGIAAAWKEAPEGLSLDALRYGLERTEIEGYARRTEDVQALRDALSKNGFSVRLGEVQQISDGGMRFNMHLSEGGRS